MINALSLSNDNAFSTVIVIKGNYFRFGSVFIKIKNNQTKKKQTKTGRFRFGFLVSVRFFGFIMGFEWIYDGLAINVDIASFSLKIPNIFNFFTPKLYCQSYVYQVFWPLNIHLYEIINVNLVFNIFFTFLIFFYFRKV